MILKMKIVYFDLNDFDLTSIYSWMIIFDFTKVKIKILLF